MDKKLTIQEKFLLLDSFRCYVEASGFVNCPNDLVYFDEVYLETLEHLAIQF